MITAVAVEVVWCCSSHFISRARSVGFKLQLCSVNKWHAGWWCWKQLCIGDSRQKKKKKEKPCKYAIGRLMQVIDFPHCPMPIFSICPSWTPSIYHNLLYSSFWSLLAWFISFHSVILLLAYSGHFTDSILFLHSGHQKASEPHYLLAMSCHLNFSEVLPWS